MKALALILVLALAGCQAAAPVGPRGPEMPTGTGPVQHEPGFSRVCHEQPHQGICP